MSPTILVTGGTGTLGTHVVREIQQRGRDVRVLSRQQQPRRTGVDYARGDLLDDTGIVDAVVGVDVIVHCASAKRGDDTATRNLVAAATATGRRPHVVFVSIVGAAGVPFGYFRTKAEAERIVAASGLPWTIQRATQFYDFIYAGAATMTRLPVVPVPKGFRCQPIDAVEVATRLVDLAFEPPGGQPADIGGPQQSTWADLVRRYLRATERRRPVVEVPLPRMAQVRHGCLLAHDGTSGGDRPYGRTTWEQFLDRTLRPGVGASHADLR